MKTIILDYKYNFKYGDISLDDYCTSSKIYKGNIRIINKLNNNFNLKFNHPIKELIWFARTNIFNGL